MGKILRTYEDVIRRILWKREDEEGWVLWSYHPKRSKGFLPYAVGIDELLLTDGTEVPDYVKSYFEPTGEHEVTMRVVELKSLRGSAFIPLPCEIELAREIRRTWREWSRLRKYEVTLRFESEGQHPSHWDWETLLDLAHVEVVSAKETR